MAVGSLFAYKAFSLNANKIKGNSLATCIIKLQAFRNPDAKYKYWGKKPNEMKLIIKTYEWINCNVAAKQNYLIMTDTKLNYNLYRQEYLS